MTDNRNQAMDLIRSISQKMDPNKNLYLVSIMHHCYTCFSTGVNPRTGNQVSVSEKDGLYYIFGHLKSQIVYNSFIKDKIEHIL